MLRSSFRLYAGVLTAALCAQGIWLLGAEIVRPALPYFPLAAQDARDPAGAETAAAAAAWIGWPRGALWVDYAMTANAGAVADIASGVKPPPGPSTQDVSEEAARLSPSDARAWLLLAVADDPSLPGSGSLRALKMSYYTSPYNEQLFPLRIGLLAKAAAPADDELRSSVDYELEHILRRRTDLKSQIAAAFATASPAGHQVLEDSLAKIDKAFLSQLRAAPRPRP